MKMFVMQHISLNAKRPAVRGSVEQQTQSLYADRHTKNRLRRDAPLLNVHARTMP